MIMFTASILRKSFNVVETTDSHHGFISFYILKSLKRIFSPQKLKELPATALASMPDNDKGMTSAFSYIAAAVDCGLQHRLVLPIRGLA